MRPKPCWSDSLGLEIIIGWIAAAIVATGLVLLSECAVTPAHAGWLLEGTLGASFLNQTAPDGRWRQEAFGSAYDGLTFSYGGNLSYRFEAPYSIQAGLLTVGTNRTESKFVWDHCYDDKSHTVHCGDVMHLKTADTYRLYHLSASRYFKMGDHWEVPVSLGVALATHRLRADVEDMNIPQVRYGRIPMWSIGSGLCWQQMLCWDTTLYQAIGGQNYHDETSQQIITSLFTVKIPLGS